MPVVELPEPPPMRTVVDVGAVVVSMTACADAAAVFDRAPKIYAHVVGPTLPASQVTVKSPAPLSVIDATLKDSTIAGVTMFKLIEPRTTRRLDTSGIPTTRLTFACVSIYAPTPTIVVQAESWAPVK